MYFWVIRELTGQDITPGRIHATEGEAWSAVVRKPFTLADYKQKGYHAVKIDAQAARREIEALQRYV